MYQAIKRPAFASPLPVARVEFRRSVCRRNTNLKCSLAKEKNESAAKVETGTGGVAFLRDLTDTSGTKTFAEPERGAVQGAWSRHRTRTRYARHLFGFPFSKLARRLAPISLLTVLECLGMEVYHHFTGVVPQFSAGPVAYMSGVVGLLLAFRTNASLARYYEARGSWSTVISKSNDVCRVALEYINKSAVATDIGSRKDELRTHQLVRYVASYCHCLASHLEGAADNVVQSRIEHLLADRELEVVLRSRNRPSAVLQLVSNAGGESADMDHHIRTKLDGAISLMNDAANSLEKLLRTPIPLSYTRHTSRACLLWCFYIPLTLFGDMGAVGSAVASGLITFLLLGIEVCFCHCFDFPSQAEQAESNRPNRTIRLYEIEEGV